jgi:hypothetical protein
MNIYSLQLWNEFIGGPCRFIDPSVPRNRRRRQARGSDTDKGQEFTASHAGTLIVRVPAIEHSFGLRASQRSAAGCSYEFSAAL